MTQVQVFSCEFHEISKNTIFTEHLCVSASEIVSKNKPLNENLIFSAVKTIIFLK